MSAPPDGAGRGRAGQRRSLPLQVNTGKWSVLALGSCYQRNRRRILLLPSALINLWIIVGIGMVGGFWDHVVKGIICALHGGVVPASLELGLTSPELDSAAYETAWILTLFAAVAAAVFGYRFVHATTVGQSRPA